MTPAERKAVAETLREWAAWCEANPGKPWWHVSLQPERLPIESFKAAQKFCTSPGFRAIPFHFGPTAATGLLLAAAMVEAGDSI
jgi:hypothetical protein